MAKEPKDTSDRMTRSGSPLSAPEPAFTAADCEGQRVRSRITNGTRGSRSEPSRMGQRVWSPHSTGNQSRLLGGFN
jgi:hypothetical protein